MDKIRHSGVVDAISGDHVTVRIVQSAACALCKSASHCQASERKEKLVDVYGCKERVSVGDRVTVLAAQRVGYTAVVLSALVPLAVMVATLTAVVCITGDEVLSALSALGSLVPYYAVLYLLRGQLRRKLAFEIAAVGPSAGSLSDEKSIF